MAKVSVNEFSRGMKERLERVEQKETRLTKYGEIVAVLVQHLPFLQQRTETITSDKTQ